MSDAVPPGDMGRVHARAGETGEDDVEFAPYREMWRGNMDYTLRLCGAESDEAARKGLEKRFARNARRYAAELGRKIRLLQQRSGYIGAVAALPIIVFVLLMQSAAVPSALDKVLGVVAVVLAGTAIIAAIAPYVSTVWHEEETSEDPTFIHTLQAYDDFTSWATYNFLAEARLKMILTFMRAHRTAIPLTMAALAIMVVWLVIRTLS